MAVLSACESGLGKGYKGEGMISMASAFTYSGCLKIRHEPLESDDQASITLMDNFYTHLLEEQSIDAALRASKLTYLESADELMADPKIWAPLVAYGSLDHVFQKDRSRTIFISLALALTALLLFFFVRKRKL